MADSMFERAIQQALSRRITRLPFPLAVELPGGARVGPIHANLTLRILKKRALIDLAAGQVGRVAQAYVEGDMEIDGQLRDLMRVVPALLDGDPCSPPHNALARWWQGLRRSLWERTHHSRTKDAAQIQQHYDVSDDFYALWLDPRRVYSCAYYAHPAMTLEEAQEAKLDHICRKLMLKPGERFIDIGAGWGGLMLWAAEHYGVQATGITLSRNQHLYVNRLIEEKGLQGRVKMLLQDYRDVDETVPFDKVASVGMCEHVGRPNLSNYFAKIRRLLTPGGLVLNHGITAGGVENTQLNAGMGDFIERYIFPGGQLLHIGAMSTALTRGGLEAVDMECLRPHYAKTLWAWVDALECNLDAARRTLGEGAEKVIRAYRLYLAGSALGFEQGWISVFQMIGTRPDREGTNSEDGSSGIDACHSQYPFQRDYIYQSRADVNSAAQAPASNSRL